MEAGERRDLERFRFWQGQALRAADLRDELRVDDELRWWHDRAVHDAYGVRLGLAVEAVPEAGAPLSLQVAPGIAYDGQGRPLLLQEPATVPLPPPPPGPAPTGMLLVATYRPSSAYLDRGRVDGVCPRCGRAALGEAPDLGWVLERGFDPCAGVALARIASDGGAWALDDGFSPLPTRPQARPHLHCAVTLPGASPWKAWRGPDPAQGPALGVEVSVDTSAAGFTQVPHYLAWLRGWEPLASRVSALVLTHVAEPTPTQFLFRVVFAAARPVRQLPSMGAARVLWIGCEEPAVAGVEALLEERPCCC
jgi:hypothetical protein